MFSQKKQEFNRYGKKKLIDFQYTLLYWSGMCHISFILSIFTKNIQNNVSERLQTMHVPRKCTKMAMINQKKIGSQACGTESTHQSLTYEVSVCLSQQFLFFNAIARDSAKPRENTVRDLYRALYKRQFSKKYLCFPLRPSFFKKCLKRKVNISAYRTLKSYRLASMMMA